MTVWLPLAVGKARAVAGRDGALWTRADNCLTGSGTRTVATLLLATVRTSVGARIVLRGVFKSGRSWL